MTNTTDKFLKNLLALNSRKIPKNILNCAKRCLIDYLGASYAGSVIANNKIKFLKHNLGMPKGNFPILGLNFKTDIINSSFLNGIVSHTAELDDGIISGIIHPGTVIFSVMLPYAMHHKVKGNDFLRGIILGYEAGSRISNCIQPSHKLRGYHATATCGSLGAVVGTMIMMKEPLSSIKAAFSSAVITAGGSLKVLEDKSELKPFNSGMGSITAAISVALGKSKFIGPDDVLSGPFGFLKMFSDKYDISKLFPKKNFAIDKVYFKPYASCRYCHSSIDAIFKLKKNFDIDIKKIEKILIETYSLAVKGHNHNKIPNPSSAKMSIPFCVAQALINSGTSIQSFTYKTIKNKNTLSLAKKTIVTHNTNFSKKFPSKSIASVTIKFIDGKTISSKVNYPKGAPENPMSDVEIKNKFKDLAIFSGIKSKEIEKLCNSVFMLPRNINKFYNLISKIHS